MSYDLEVRSDDKYSRTASREETARFIQDEFGARRADASFLLIEDSASGQHIEIDLSFVTLEEAKAIPEEEGGTVQAGRINSVSIAVPYPFLKASGETALHVGSAVASHLGWRMFDPQGGSDVSESDLAAARANQLTLGPVVGHLQDQHGIPPRQGFLNEMMWRFIGQTKYSLAVVAVVAIVIVCYALLADQKAGAAPRVVGIALFCAFIALFGKPLVETLHSRHQRP